MNGVEMEREKQMDERIFNYYEHREVHYVKKSKRKTNKRVEQKNKQTMIPRHIHTERINNYESNVSAAQCRQMR